MPFGFYLDDLIQSKKICALTKNMSHNNNQILVLKTIFTDFLWFSTYFMKDYLCAQHCLVVDHHCVKLTERSNLSRRRRKKTKRYLGISRSTKCFVKLNCLCHSMQNNFGTKLNDNIFKCRKTLREANRVKTYSSIKSERRIPIYQLCCSKTLEIYAPQWPLSQI